MRLVVDDDIANTLGTPHRVLVYEMYHLGNPRDIKYYQHEFYLYY